MTAGSHSARSPAELFGEDRLLALVRSQYRLTADTPAGQIIDAAREFALPDAPEDDMSVVVAKRLPK
ncbi:MAG: hypothetical protein O3C40_20680 [Planctomycetota bacterium]|nr:hypothetical protein [Planctomycetota bacterium]